MVNCLSIKHGLGQRSGQLCSWVTVRSAVHLIYEVLAAREGLERGCEQWAVLGAMSVWVKVRFRAGISVVAYPMHSITCCSLPFKLARESALPHALLATPRALAACKCSLLQAKLSLHHAVICCYQNLPRDMALSHALDTSVFEMVWLPEEPPEPDVEVM